MATSLWESPSINAFNARLDGTLDGNSTSITLDSTSGLVAPGVLVIDRVDGSNNDTPTKREYVTFTGISSNTITGVTRGVNSTAQSHNSGAVVEANPTVTHWGDLVDFLQSEHNSTGKHVISTATINYTQTYNLAGTSLASISKAYISNLIASSAIISNVTISGLINVSGASIVGLVTGVGGLSPFTIVGQVAAGTNVTPFLVVEDAMTLKSVSAVLKSPVSGASLVLDINKNLTTIFTDQNTRLSILAGGTYASTASLSITALTSGNLISLDVDNSAGGGGDLTVLLET